MDRKLLVKLFREGMVYPTGKHQFWISRCFEITVRPDKVVELDEYEGFSADPGKKGAKRKRPQKKGRKGMFHVGRSILDMKEGRIVEEAGGGWGKEKC